MPANKKNIRSLAVVTPGGDAPGMNTAIRAVTRTALYHHCKVFGIQRGWYGLINNLISELTRKSVSGIINRGGTILHTARCPEFRDKKMRAKAYQNLKRQGIDALVAIGGDGSLTAASLLMREFGLPVNVIPATIDNDIPCTEYTIGFDTAVNTALEAIDKIRDTATSHERIFIVEVMGRENGFIALDVALAAGAEAVIIPEVKLDINKLVKKIRTGQQDGKSSFIIVVAEGAVRGEALAEIIRSEVKGIDVRVSVLGHMQRGGTPTAFSRELACKLGAAAVELLLKGKAGYLVGTASEHVKITPIAEVLKQKKRTNLPELRLIEMLSV